MQGVATSAAVGLGRKRLRRAEHLLATIVCDFARELVRPLELRDAIGHFAAPQPFHRVFVGWWGKWGAQPLGRSLGGALLHQRGSASVVSHFEIWVESWTGHPHSTNFEKKMNYKEISVKMKRFRPRSIQIEMIRS